MLPSKIPFVITMEYWWKQSIKKNEIDFLKLTNWVWCRRITENLFFTTVSVAYMKMGMADWKCTPSCTSQPHFHVVLSRTEAQPFQPWKAPSSTSSFIPALPAHLVEGIPRHVPLRRPFPFHDLFSPEVWNLIGSKLNRFSSLQNQHKSWLYKRPTIKPWHFYAVHLIVHSINSFILSSPFSPRMSIHKVYETKCKIYLKNNNNLKSTILLL